MREYKDWLYWQQRIGYYRGERNYAASSLQLAVAVGRGSGYWEDQ